MNAFSFKFQQFAVKQEQCAMKTGTDSIILGSWAESRNNSCILDIGTGTGILSLMMAQKCNAKIDAVELDEKAHYQAKENFDNSPFAHQISCHHTDIQIFEPNKKYDIIICNPPYFETIAKTKEIRIKFYLVKF